MREWAKCQTRMNAEFCLSRPYSFKYFKGCLPQILLGPFLNTLSHIVPLHKIVNYETHGKYTDKKKRQKSAKKSAHRNCRKNNR